MKKKFNQAELEYIRNHNGDNLDDLAKAVCASKSSVSKVIKEMIIEPAPKELNIDLEQFNTVKRAVIPTSSSGATVMTQDASSRGDEFRKSKLKLDRYQDCVAPIRRK